MKKTDFNENWTVRCLTRDSEPQSVTLPHDAMISEPRTPDSHGEGNIGWFIGGDYEYKKTFFVPEEWRTLTSVFEFEGVYHNAEIYLNGRPVLFRPYGYTNFYVPADQFLQYGAENEITVIARNADQPNSRWYSGTGLYRPVNLWQGKGRYICLNGVKIRTLDYRSGEIEARVELSAPGTVKIEILDGQKTVLSYVRNLAESDRVSAALSDGTSAAAPDSASENTPAEITCRFVIPNAKLWDTEHPNLYKIRVSTEDDIVEEYFGIRTLAWNAKSGMTINGKRVILRGACVHHDNGILGACAFPEAEERKVRLHKENGYNALRSAHNPCSKAFLDACDRLGMLVMDEYADAWYMHKTKYDYVTYLKDWWRQDLRDMVEKDYNHPCVILYSTGNEVAETAREKGIAFTGEMTQYLHSLDNTRPVTCGINIFFNFLSSVGFGVYSDEKAEKQSAAAEKNAAKKRKKAVGSEFYNKLACLMGDRFMKFGATLYPCDLKTRGAYANMDIAGYNYGIWRYKKDLKKYPERLILGTETFCKDAWLFWDLARDNPRILGDFVWAGMDYIGETGMGAPEYGDYKLDAVETQMTGGNGRIDLTGTPRAEAAYTRVALGQETGPWIGVQPVDRSDNPGLTGWSLTKALESWSWSGCSGKSATVEVYARAEQIEILLNGQSIGKKPVHKTYRTVFQIPYEPGELTAVAFDAAGKEIRRHTLRSAGESTVLQILPEESYAQSGKLCFIRLKYTDQDGIWKPQERHMLKLHVEHAELLACGNANAYVRGNYMPDVTDTYYGEALAVIRADGTGDVRVAVWETDPAGKANPESNPEDDLEKTPAAAERIIPLSQP